jgi:hypothetical protein
MPKRCWLPQADLRQLPLSRQFGRTHLLTRLTAGKPGSPIDFLRLHSSSHLQRCCECHTTWAGRVVQTASGMCRGRLALTPMWQLSSLGLQISLASKPRSTHSGKAESLLLWSVVQRGKLLASLIHADSLAYKVSLAGPSPRDRCVSEQNCRHPKSESRWCPFAGSLSTSSQPQAIIILNSMFAWLVNAGYPIRRVLRRVLHLLH